MNWIAVTWGSENQETDELWKKSHANNTHSKASHASKWELPQCHKRKSGIMDGWWTDDLNLAKKVSMFPKNLKTPVLVQYMCIYIYRYPAYGYQQLYQHWYYKYPMQGWSWRKANLKFIQQEKEKRMLSYHIHLVSTLNIPNWYWVLF